MHLPLDRVVAISIGVFDCAKTTNDDLSSARITLAKRPQPVTHLLATTVKVGGREPARRAVTRMTAAVVVVPVSASGYRCDRCPQERIVPGGIGIGRRGGYDLGCFLEQPDFQFVAVADIEEKRRGEVKKIADDKHGDSKTL